MTKKKNYIYFDEEEEFCVAVYEVYGEICPYFVLKNGVFKQIAGYVSIKADLDECLEGIKSIEKIKESDNFPQIIKTSLLFTGIIKYARCFTSGKGRGISLNKKDIFKENSSLLQFHEETMEIRNKYLAHAGKTKHETRALIATLNLDKSNKKIENYNFSSSRLINNDSNLENYIELFDWVMNKVTSKVEKLDRTVREHLVEIPIKKMYKEAKTPDRKKLIPIDIHFI